MTSATPELTTGGVEVDRDAVMAQLREGVCRAIRGLNLPGLPPDRVYNRSISDARGLPTPCVMVAKTRGQFASGPGTNARADNTYAIVVTLIRASTRSADGASDNAVQLDGWFSRVARAFAGVRPPFLLRGACFSGPSAVVDNDPLMAAQWIRQMDAAYLVIRFPVREARGG